MPGGSNALTAATKAACAAAASGWLPWLCNAIARLLQTSAATWCAGCLEAKSAHRTKASEARPSRPPSASRSRSSGSPSAKMADSASASSARSRSARGASCTALQATHTSTSPALTAATEAPHAHFTEKQRVRSMGSSQRRQRQSQPHFRCSTSRRCAVVRSRYCVGQKHVSTGSPAATGLRAISFASSSLAPGTSAAVGAQLWFARQMVGKRTSLRRPSSPANE
mmetsp:Transcript_41381/g.128625  ORF Transcript_41381/g.128625 Transcript_41381/m.128625 type:complete len:225 (-) Transcript_41381:353-1027(-)